MLSIKKLPTHAIWHVEADDRWELAMTFLRMEEYYESPNPEFQGKVFSLEKYMDWYVQTYRQGKRPYGAFTYASDWSAFNVPGYAVKAVREQFTDHSAKESLLFTELEKQGAFAGAKFYLIGNAVGANAFFQHEYRHALYALDEHYRAKITEVVDRYALPELRSWILERYAPTVLRDEIQAYALTGWPGRGCPVTDEMRVFKKELRTIEKQFIPAR